MMKIYTLGNPLLKKDRLALEVAEELKNKLEVEFVEFDPIETIEGDVWLMDVVKGVKDVELITEDHFEKNKVYSMHDLDLSHMLALLKKTGKIKSFKLIAIPFGMKKKEAAKKVERLLKSLSI
ncbi:MAG: hypothetical protein QXR09_00280 [Candidatus Aenigmatarchaeota archaeon]